MLGGLVVCGVSELAVLGDLQPGWGGRDWGGQAVPRWGQRHTRVCWTQGGKLPLLQDTKEESADLLRRIAVAWVPAPAQWPPPEPAHAIGHAPSSSPRTTAHPLLFHFSPSVEVPSSGIREKESYPRLLIGPSTQESRQDTSSKASSSPSPPLVPPAQPTSSSGSLLPAHPHPR